MPKAVVYRNEELETWGTDATVADGVTEIKQNEYSGRKDITSLRFLENSAIRTVRRSAFQESGVTSLHGMERVIKIGIAAFAWCKDLCTIEGLGCEEMGRCCFVDCHLLQSLKGWPVSMTTVPPCCFAGCTGLIALDCNFTHVTSLGVNAFAGCTSLLPPSLSQPDVDPAPVLAFLKEMASNERAAALTAVVAAQSTLDDLETKMAAL